MKTNFNRKQETALKHIFHLCLNRWITEKEVAFQNWFLLNYAIRH